MTTRFPSSPQIAWLLQILRAATCLLCLTCGAAPATLAQSTGEQPLKGMLAARAEKLLAALDLNEAKKARVKDVLDSHREAVDDVVAREDAARDALRKAVQRETVDEAAVTEATDALALVDRELIGLRATIYAELADVLNDVQRVKLVHFLAVLNREVGARELAAASPRTLLQGLELTAEEDARIAEVLQSHKAAVDTIEASAEVAGATLAVVLNQPAPTETMLDTAAKSVAKARKRLAIERAKIFSELHPLLTASQQQELRKRTARLDQGVVARHRAAAVLFLQFL